VANSYFYHCVQCKTSDCKTWLRVKYIGPDIGVRSTTLSLTGALLVPCTICNETHAYRMKDIQQQKFADRPSPDFIDMF